MINVLLLIKIRTFASMEEEYCQLEVIPNSQDKPELAVISIFGLILLIVVCLKICQ